MLSHPRAPPPPTAASTGPDRRRVPPPPSLPPPPIHSPFCRYEEEEEFDALKDALQPKQCFLVAAPSSSGAGGAPSPTGPLRSYLQPVKIHAAFAAPSAELFAKQLWAGRDGPPYFHRLRLRAALDEATTDAAVAAAAWDEFLNQNWKTELDAGLGVAETTENLLLVCSPAAVEQLLHAALPAGAGVEELSSGTLSVLAVRGTQHGEDKLWQQLERRLVLVGKAPSHTESLSLRSLQK